MTIIRGTRRLAAPLALALCAGVFAGCGSDGGSGGSGSHAPIKVALLPPSGGALAQMGADAARGWKYAAAEANAAGGVDGHRVEIIEAATDGTPAATVRAARKAVTQRGARFLSGVITSPEHGALQQQLPSMGALSLLGLGKDDALTGAGCSADAFRAVHSTQMEINALTRVLKDLPGKTWAILAVDYSTGHTAAKNFAAAARAAGKQVVAPHFVPLNTTDFGSAITQLRQSGADSLFALVPGADGATFIKQASQYRLFSQIKTVYGFQMVSEPALKALGRDVLGFYTNIGYDVTAKNARNEAFVAGYEKQFGTPPYSVPADHYMAAQLLFAAIRKAGSIDVDKVRTAMNGITFDSFAGPVRMAADHQLARPAYVGKVVERGSGLGFRIVATVPETQTHPKPDPACKL